MDVSQPCGANNKNRGVKIERNDELLKESLKKIYDEIDRLERTTIKPSEKVNKYLTSIGTSEITTGVKLSELLKRTEVTYNNMAVIDNKRSELSNVIKNAEDAMKNNGSINIVMNINNDIVSVSLKDTGIGMNQETLENCFDPMFSTKTAKAVGMGLTVAKQVVEMHNGTISVDSIENQGTTIDITLPVLKEE